MSFQPRKVLLGAFSVVFLLLLCQIARAVFRKGTESVCNSGGAFGADISTGILFGVTLGILVLFGVQWWREEEPLLVWAWVILFSGGLSNLLERVFFGCVTDYLAILFFPVFNLADVLLTVGVAGILLSVWQRRKRVGINVKTQITNTK